MSTEKLTPSGILIRGYPGQPPISDDIIVTVAKFAANSKLPPDKLHDIVEEYCKLLENNNKKASKPKLK